ncbi:kinase-like domain-containing protein [Leucosporidium creatinivorum]|uniref:Kinase-like domain-containing protein n=1 Tax=Leucosporidium creatinivorum TaxID=106004 RepID=A0A1Y2DPL6_9BASI|nr:kinase-like domain-containing protein [Leucosporidium creatinivorum]
MDSTTPQQGSPASSSPRNEPTALQAASASPATSETASPLLGGAARKNRNKKGLALGAASAKPGTLSNTSAAALLSASSTSSSSSSKPQRQAPSRPAPIQVARSTRYSTNTPPSSSPPLLPSTPSLSSSSTASTRSSYHNKLSEQLATLELGVEFKLDLRSEDLEVLSELGCGNGGTVSRCLHGPTRAIMAKKVVHIATSESTRKQILRELQIMHDCSSPYIVSFYGAYLQDPHICMCMEYMDKGSLDNIYKKVGPIPEPILGKIAFAVVSGLTYLYEVHKIMHRDVKPSNVLLNSAGQIKICDFGVSGELINSVADTFVGTSTYMSPERISGDPYTVKSDVWSLGITLVELALGRFPFSSDDGEESEDEEEAARYAADLMLGGVQEEVEGENGEEEEDVGDDTLSPVRPAKKGESVQQAEAKRAAKREAARTRTSSTSSARSLPQSSSSASAKRHSVSTPASRRKSVAGVSLAGSGHQMSILELLQYIVNEPAPKLPVGKFSAACEEFVNATLRKEPVGWNVKKKGPLPKETARPTPRELLDYKWMTDVAAADTDVEAFAKSIP